MSTADTCLSRSPTEICWEEIAHDDHSVQIYADSQSFLDALEGFASSGLRAGESVIVIATEVHRRALERKLERRGYKLEQTKLGNRYIAVDAEATLAQFMVDGRVDSEKFNAFYPCAWKRPTRSCVWRDGGHFVGTGRPRLDNQA